MLGAIIGDIVGSRYEWNNIKTTEFELFSKECRFTDDSVLTIAVADAIVNKKTYTNCLKYWAKKYPEAGYGGSFLAWFSSDSDEPYHSWGNGAAMRVSAIGLAFDTLEKVIAEARKSAEITHNHEEGIRGAESTASAVFMANQGKSKAEIKKYIEDTYNYDLSRTLDEIRPYYKFDYSCAGSIPEAIIAFLESENYEDAIRKAVSIGGDSDTIACITGGIAQAFYKTIPSEIVTKAKSYLSAEMLDVLDKFNETYDVVYKVKSL